MVNYHGPQYFSKRIWKVGATWAYSLASFFLSKYTFGWCTLATIMWKFGEKNKIHSQFPALKKKQSSWWSQTTELEEIYLEEKLYPKACAHWSLATFRTSCWFIVCLLFSCYSEKIDESTCWRKWWKIIVYSSPCQFFGTWKEQTFFCPNLPTTYHENPWNTYHICIQKNGI